MLAPLDVGSVHAIGTLGPALAGAGDGRRPLVHFAHATGMCAGIYGALLERIAARADVVASDFRGHGATALAADPTTLRDWTTYADDLAALVGHLPPASRLVLAGHSMGATVSLLLAARLGARVAGVVMIEPAFVPLAVAPAYDRSTWPNPMALQAVKRRGVWPSRAALRAAYHGRGVFADWPDADLDAYLAGGVRDRADGQVELACTPAWEAATFTAVSTGMATALADYTGPVTLLHGTAGSTVLPADAATIAARPDTQVVCFAGASHFLPLAEPAAMADAILALACDRGE